MKNFISKLFLLLGIICVVGCSNISLDNSKTTENSNTEVGTLIINKNANRALDVAAIEYAKVTIIGSDISYEISKMSDKVLNGKGSFEIQGIPVGNNRVVVVDAYANSDERMNGITITAVTDIVPGDNVLDEINWETSKLGNVYKALIEAKVKTNDFTADDEAAVAAVIPSVNHAMLIDTVSIAEDFKNDALKTSSDYKLSTSKVNIVARYAKGYSFYVDDPISSKSEANPLKITADDTSNKTYSIDDVAPGLWTLHITDPDGKVSTKAISVDGSGATVSGGVYAGQEKIDGYRVHFYGTSWSSYYLYYYSSDESKNGAAWPGKKLTKSADGNTYYIDLTDSWVAGGDTLCIFAESSSPGNNRYPADMQPGVVLPSGVNQVWFNFATKQFVTTSPFSTDPVVSVSPSGDVQFSGTNTSVTIRADYCTTAKYTTDGSDPKSSASAIEFASSEVIKIGDGLNIGSSVTVKVWGTDGSIESEASATYTKVDKPSTPTRLGAYYTKTATSFSIWSPDSSNVKVVVTPKGGSAKEYTCTSGFQVDGNYPDSSKIYGVTVSGDLHLAE
ncbi:MAG: starch-binding protein, partial [Treponema sp.]|nr:starch-binding protein [Treponema sp.]